MHRNSGSMALAAMAGAKPSFKGSLEKDQQAYLASNVCADDGSAALDGCKRAARQHVKPSPSSSIISFPSLALPIRCLAESAVIGRFVWW